MWWLVPCSLLFLVPLFLSSSKPPWCVVCPVPCFALALVFTYSGGFEILEWVVAVIVDPKAGAAYLGIQGDEFDSQKDMALAASGALISLVMTASFSANTQTKDWPIR